MASKNTEKQGELPVEPTVPKKKRVRKTDFLGMISSLNADAIRTRLAEIDSEQAALKALLTVAEARDKKETPAEKVT